MARAASPELGIRLACITLSLSAHLLLVYGALRGDRAPVTPPQPLVMAARWGEAPAASAPNAAPRAPKSQPAKAQAPVRAAPRTQRPPVAKPAATPVVKPLSLASARPAQAAPKIFSAAAIALAIPDKRAVCRQLKQFDKDARAQGLFALAGEASQMRWQLVAELQQDKSARDCSGVHETGDGYGHL